MAIAGRLQTLANGSSTETSIYNALGQRIEISGGVNGTVLYAYDEAGHLMGEYDGTGVGGLTNYIVKTRCTCKGGCGS